SSSCRSSISDSSTTSGRCTSSGGSCSSRTSSCRAFLTTWGEPDRDGYHGGTDPRPGQDGEGHHVPASGERGRRDATAGPSLRGGPGAMGAHRAVPRPRSGSNGGRSQLARLPGGRLAPGGRRRGARGERGPGARPPGVSARRDGASDRRGGCGGRIAGRGGARTPRAFGRDEGVLDQEEAEGEGVR